MKTKLLSLIAFGMFAISANSQTVTIAIVGEAVGGWPPSPQPVGYTDPKQMISPDNTNYGIQNLMVTTAIVGGGAKFRAGNDWTTSWGATSFPGGIGTVGGPNINTVAGTYNVGFNRTTGQYLFSQVTAGLNDSKTTSFMVYPNPTQNDWRFVSTDLEIDAITITDISGKVIANKIASGLETNIDASNFPSGVYFAKIASGSKSQTLKLFKN